VHLFVYGSLKRGHGRLADLLWMQAEFAGEATMRGRLYEVGRYAGMVDGAGVVHGEVARLRTPETTLEQMDEYEGEAYERVRRTATLAAGETIEAMVYFYRGGLEKAKPLPAGRWPEISSE
jgi:gamma-glutamylcyclotransferase (GGCT)/AIG2-like uncharacterized protein YtfP